MLIPRVSEIAAACRATNKKHSTLALMSLLLALTPASLTAGSTQSISVSPTVVNFGNQIVNTSGPQTVSIVNSTRHTAILQSVAIQGSSAFSLSNWNGPVTLRPSEGFQLSVVFRPTANINYSGTVVITNGRGLNQYVAIQGVGVPGASTSPNSVQIATSSMPTGQVGTPLSVTVTAVGGIQPYKWAVSSGSLPLGIALDNAASTIHGTPTQYGNFVFTLQVQDSSSTPLIASRSFTMPIAAVVVPVSIATTSLPSGEVSSPYSSTLLVTGGTAPYAWSTSSGSLPAGLSLAAATGTISGTPAQPGTYSFTVQVRDSSTTPQTASSSLSIGVNAASAVLSWNASTSPNILGYNIYRSTISGGSYVRINPSVVSGLTYADNAVVAGQTYYYVTTAIDSSSVESPFSNEVQISIH